MLDKRNPGLCFSPLNGAVWAARPFTKQLALNCSLLVAFCLWICETLWAALQFWGQWPPWDGVYWGLCFVAQLTTQNPFYIAKTLNDFMLLSYFFPLVYLSKSELAAYLGLDWVLKQTCLPPTAFIPRQDYGHPHPTSFSNNPINRISTQRGSSQVGLIGLHNAKQAQCNRNSIPRRADEWLQKHFTCRSKFSKKLFHGSYSLLCPFPVETLLFHSELTLPAFDDGWNANVLFCVCLRCQRMSTFPHHHSLPICADLSRTNTSYMCPRGYHTSALVPRESFRKEGSFII